VNKNNKERSALYHVRVVSGQTRCVEIDCDSSMLNSRDAFILRPNLLGQTEFKVYLWVGKMCEFSEKLPEVVKKFQEVSKRYNLPVVDYVKVEENSEPEEFWDSLGSRKEYLNVDFHLNLGSLPRLFVCSAKSGEFSVKEIPEYSQNHLTIDEYFFLDAIYNVYIWVGPGSSETEKKSGSEIANKYAGIASRARGTTVNVINVTENYPLEPREFTRHFHAWNYKESTMDPRARSLLKFEEQKRREELLEREKEKIRQEMERQEEEKRKIEEAENSQKIQEQEISKDISEENPEKSAE